MRLPEFFEEDLQLVDAALQKLLPAADTSPKSIHEAMRYSVFAGGKRIRPILCLESARVFAAGIAPALHPACAIEFIHTYSLIHDDLPALDNDDLRRGKPTCHKKFGEAIAILAGDGLLTFAFDILSRPQTHPKSAIRVELISALAKAHQVIAVELQAHGHTKDIDRPLSFERDADDVAALLKQLNIDKAEIMGFSNGGTTALQIAIRHPGLVNKLVLASAT